MTDLTGYLTLADYARIRGIKYQAAWNRYKAGKISSAIKHNNRILVSKEEFADIEIETNIKKPDKNKACIYARVSDPKKKDQLNSQAKRCANWAQQNGYQIVRIAKEKGSGLNDNRRVLNSVLKDTNYGTLIIEHKDRLTRYGFNQLKLLMEMTGREILVINTIEDDTTDLINDLISVIYSFSARLYGKRRTERATKAIKALGVENKTEVTK